MGLMTERPTIAGAVALAESAHAKINSHEELCAERYATIAGTLSELKADSKDQRQLIITTLAAVAGSALLLLVSVVLFKSGLIG